MRGSESFDGKISGNRQMVDRYNESKGKKKHQRPQETGGASGGMREPGGHDEIKNVVDEHGAAIHHAIHKTHQGYESITHHEDGHIHHATHGSLEEAHEHGAHAMGDDTAHLGDMPKEDEEVASEHAEMEDEGSGSRGGGMPRVGYMS
jgi:hypothetical protein